MSNIVNARSMLPPRLPALSDAMLTELDGVRNGPVFRPAPDLSALLNYLVVCTLDGDDYPPTPNTITVEGFVGVRRFETEYSDAPQRHIDRLRTALERHYTHSDPVKGFCLTLIAGSYRVWLVRPEVAYPLIFMRLKMTEWPLVPQAQRISMESIKV